MAGVSPTTISGIESGKIARPHLKTLLKIAHALGVDVGELRESGKAGAPPSSIQPPLNGFEEERRATEAEIIADYERITREHRMAWRAALDALADPWEERLSSGAFDRGMVEQFFTDVAAISGGVSRALAATIDEEHFMRRKYKAPPTQADVDEMWASAIAPPAARLLTISDRVYAAAAERFGRSELDTVRQKRDEAMRGLRRVA
jgi:transcriptional regulator with XRE-family HTH domain